MRVRCEERKDGDAAYYVLRVSIGGREFGEATIVDDCFEDDALPSALAAGIRLAGRRSLESK